MGVLGLIVESAWSVGTFGRERDEYAIEVGNRHDYPWQFTNVWTGDMRPVRARKERRHED